MDALLITLCKVAALLLHVPACHVRTTDFERQVLGRLPFLTVAPTVHCQVIVSLPVLDIPTECLGSHRMSPRSGERLRLGSKGFAPSEMEPRTSDGELVTDLLARAGAEFERKSSVSRSATLGSSPSASDTASVPSPHQVRDYD